MALSSEVAMKSLIERADAVYDSWEAGTIAYEDALLTLDNVIAEARDQNFIDALLSGLNNKVILLRDSGAVELAMQINQQVFEMAQGQENNRYLSYAAFNRGDILRLQGKSESARQAFREAYKFADEARDYLAAAYALHSEARIVLALQQFEQAFMLSEKGLASIDRYIESSVQHDSIYSSLQSGLNQLLARCELVRGNVDAAWERAQQAMAYAQIRNSSLEIGNTFCVFAELVIHSDNAPDGISTDFSEYYQTALSYYQKAQADSEIASTNLTYAQQLYERGRIPEAIPFVEEACRLFKKLQNGTAFLQANKLLITYRKAL